MTGIRGLAHVGIAVRSLGEALPFWTDRMGFRLTDTAELVSMGIRIAFVTVGGCELELLEPTSPGSTIARFLERRGEGIHHLSFLVDDIERAIEEALASGLELIDRSPRDGSHETRIAFLHPRAAHGVLVELCQRRTP